MPELVNKIMMDDFEIKIDRTINIRGIVTVHGQDNNNSVTA
jgi:hypothetical protein